MKKKRPSVSDCTSGRTTIRLTKLRKDGWLKILAFIESKSFRIVGWWLWLASSAGWLVFAFAKNHTTRFWAWVAVMIWSTLNLVLIETRHRLEQKQQKELAAALPDKNGGAT